MTAPRPSPPSWWPLENEPIGLDRAAELVEYLKHSAPPVIAAARAYLHERYEGLDVTVRGHNARQIALEDLKPTDDGLWVGSLAVTMAGTIMEQGVVMLCRSGAVRVTFHPKGEMGPRWSVAG